MTKTGEDTKTKLEEVIKKLLEEVLKEAQIWKRNYQLLMDKLQQMDDMKNNINGDRNIL